jgi:hypothetical protein
LLGYRVGCLIQRWENYIRCCRHPQRTFGRSPKERNCWRRVTYS